MNDKLVYILVGLVGLVTAAPQRPGQVVNYDLIESSDTVHDLVEKFLPALTDAAMREGGSASEQLQRVARSFIPIARYLVDLKGKEQPFYNVQENQKQVDMIEHTLALAFNFMAQFNTLNQPNRGSQGLRGTEQSFQEVAKIANAAIQQVAARALQAGQTGPDDQRNLQSTSSGISAILSAMGSLANQQPRSSVNG